jgi:hypothetical protein
MSPSELSDEDFLKLRARNLALGKIMHETRFGEVEGISFDLRHCQINRDEWRMDHFGGVDRFPPRRTPTLPLIWFPWYGKFDPDRLKADVTAEFKVDSETPAPPLPREAFATDTDYASYLKRHKKIKPLGKSWIREEIADRTPDAIVSVGDRIGIHQVIKYRIDEEFAHPHDRDEIHLFVKIHKQRWCR